MERVQWEWDREQVEVLDFAPREQDLLSRGRAGILSTRAQAADLLPGEVGAAGSLAEAEAEVSSAMAGAVNGSVWAQYAGIIIPEVLMGTAVPLRMRNPFSKNSLAPSRKRLKRSGLESGNSRRSQESSGMRGEKIVPPPAFFYYPADPELTFYLF